MAKATGKTKGKKKATVEPKDERPWRESFDQLRADVKTWYQAEAEALAGRYQVDPDLDKLDFAELTRRSQALLACEMIELTSEGGPPEPASAEDTVQLERVAQAMRAHGKEVPDSIRKLLDE